MKHPIDSIEWLYPEELEANDYNPNVVFNAELRLLELSILKHGWIQPILITQEKVIIDGFHRWSLSLQSKKIQELGNGKIPCVVMELTEPERMLLTIRINRAKGSHVAVKMSDIVKKVVEGGMTIEEVAKEIGASKKEVDLLLQESVFKQKDTQNHKYSKAWKPRMKIK